MSSHIETSPAPSPWHAGERRIQQILGVDARMEDLGRRVLRNHMIDQHRQFYAQLPFAVFGTVDGNGDVWATLRANHPGFLHSPKNDRLEVSLHRDPTDPADAGLEDGNAIGMLGIELSTRRRNRLNGTISRKDAGHFDIQVGQSFGNCPKYITTRDLEFIREPDTSIDTPVETSSSLGTTARAIIAASDTLFIASHIDHEDGRRDVDVSHRGGPIGFVNISDDGMLTIPDYSGNRFFNTLGNILINPRAGLVFVDFTTGDILQLTGNAEVILGGTMIDTFENAERLWQFRPQKAVYRKGAFALRNANSATD